MSKDLLDGFSDSKKTRILTEKIKKIAQEIEEEITLMEVCGTHTVAIFKSGIKSILPENVKLISGPGCPVCVTPNTYLDRAISLSRLDDLILTTFGDMMKVPGSSPFLEKEKTRGRDIRMVYSTLDAFKIAKENPNKKVVFLGVGFETTAPTVAFALKEAKTKSIKNFYVLTAHKLIPPALRFLAQSNDLKVNGFICPGHVSTIIGTEPYEFLVDEFKISCVISGFEPLDLFQSIYILLDQLKNKKARIDNQYSRAVKKEGNPVALNLMEEVFEQEDSVWRGIGVIPNSGLKIKNVYREFDAQEEIEVQVEKSQEPKGCLCGLVIQGKKSPLDCALFAKKCTPQSPVGPCMVSSEGSCQAYFKYRKNLWIKNR
ncbi:MAG: hydrogenase formation protein HypD [candidate division Zixibacteria bacterium]|nr:hydrogenase formation protein HypD [candidate division Zixibacteria bacterium]